MDITKLERRVAIDMHTHVHISASSWPDGVEDEYLKAAGEYFNTGMKRRSLVELEAFYRERDMACVVFSVDTESQDGRRPVPSEEIIEFAARHDDVLIPFGSVDPWRGAAAVRRIRNLVQLGARGFKFHPSTQGFAPNDQRFYPLYAAIEEAQVPVVFHTGQTGIGAGMRGGGGIRLKFSNPMLLDDVAADFPDLPIVMAHPSVPWQDEGIAVALHKPNVYIDLSGWSPRQFEPNLVRHVNKRLQDKVLFGSDFPVLDPERWIAAFRELPIDGAVQDKVLRTNALRLLGAIPDQVDGGQVHSDG